MTRTRSAAGAAPEAAGVNARGNDARQAGSEDAGLEYGGRVDGHPVRRCRVGGPSASFSASRFERETIIRVVQRNCSP